MKHLRLRAGLLSAALLSAAAPAMSWTNDPLQAGTTTIRAIHITELRSAIHAKRMEFWMTTTTYTNSLASPPDLSAGATLVRKVHMDELRASLMDVRSVNPGFSDICAATVPVLQATDFTDPAIAAGTTLIRSTHIAQLRTFVDRVGTARACCGLCGRGSTAGGGTCVNQANTLDLWNDCPPAQGGLAVNKFTDCYGANCSGTGLVCGSVGNGTDPGFQCPPTAGDLAAVPWGATKSAGCYDIMCDGTGGCQFVAAQSDPGSGACAGVCKVCDGVGGCTDTTVNTDPEDECNTGSGRCSVCNGGSGCTFATSGDPDNDCPPPQGDLSASSNQWAGCYGVNCGGATTECGFIASAPPGSDVNNQCPPLQAVLTPLGKVDGCYLAECNGAGGCQLVGAQGEPAPSADCPVCGDCDGAGGCAPVTVDLQDQGCNATATSCAGVEQCDGAGMGAANCVTVDQPAGSEGVGPPCATCEDCGGGAQSGTCVPVLGGTNDNGCNIAAGANPGGRCVTVSQTCNGSGGCNNNYAGSGTEGSPACLTCYDCSGTAPDCVAVLSGTNDNGCNIAAGANPGGRCVTVSQTCNGSGGCNNNYAGSGTEGSPTCAMCFDCNGAAPDCVAVLSGTNDNGCNIAAGANPGGRCVTVSQTCNGSGGCNNNYAGSGTEGSPTCAMCFDCNGAAPDCVAVLSGTNDNGCNIAAGANPGGRCVTVSQTCNGSGGCNNNYAGSGKGSPTCPMCFNCGASAPDCVAMSGGQDATAPGCTGQCRACGGGSCNTVTSGADPGGACQIQTCRTGNCTTGGACEINTGASCGSGYVPCSGQDTCNGSGVCQPNDYSAGATDNNCGVGGSISCSGWYAVSGNTCYTREPLTSGQCAGGGACKPINDGSCNSQPVSSNVQINCELCKTLNIGCSGTTPGSCSNQTNNTADYFGPETCSGICRACQGGSCGFANAGTDPDNFSCSPTPDGTSAAFCQDGSCDGFGACSGVSGIVCYGDMDGDGYGDPGNARFFCGFCSSFGGVPHVSNNTDCYDGNASVNPGQGGWFTSPRPDNGTYDYNCSFGSEERQYVAGAQIGSGGCAVAPPATCGNGCPSSGIPFTIPNTACGNNFSVTVSCAAACPSPPAPGCIAVSLSFTQGCH